MGHHSKIIPIVKRYKPAKENENNHVSPILLFLNVSWHFLLREDKELRELQSAHLGFPIRFPMNFHDVVKFLPDRVQLGTNEISDFWAKCLVIDIHFDFLGLKIELSQKIGMHLHMFWGYWNSQSHLNLGEDFFCHFSNSNFQVAKEKLFNHLLS